ncbi:MAG: FHA domain-containing protein [Deltaproteobacteria bacterium]|nr:FHA domain-containing protein [Deltaproteobacteria bacterium]
MKRVTLEIQYADNRTEMKQLEDGTYIIGRDTGDIVLKNTLVSGRHGELKVSGSQVIYTDQGSTNGTFTFNGSRLSGPLQMAAGTGLRIGECKIILKAIHVLTSKTVMQPAVKPAFSQTKTVLGQPAVMFPPSSPPPATNPASVPPAAKSTSIPPAAKPATIPPVSKSTPASAAGMAAASDAATAPTALQPSVAPQAAQPSVISESASAPAEATLATEPAPPAYDMAVIAEPESSQSAANEAAGATEDSFADEPVSFGDRFSYQMDIGALVNAPMKDKGWITKCLLIGLMTIIPVAGALNMMGWMIALYRNRKQGSEELPPANLSYIGDGVKILLAFLPVIGAFVAVAVVSVVITMVLPFLFFIGPLLNLALGLAVFAATPAILYLTVEKNISFASVKFNAIMAFAKSNTQAYVQLLIAFFVASVVSGIGGVVLIGTLLTVPFATAMQGVILSEIKEE